MPGKRRKRPETPAQLTLLRQGLRLLSRLSPRLAGRYVDFLWYRTHPTRPPAREQRLLDEAGWQTLRSAGNSVQVYTWGKGPAVLLVHGWNGCAAQMTVIARALVEQGFRAIAFDAPAHGRSPGKRTELPVISAAIQDVGRQFGPFRAAVAHSFGGMCLMHAIHQGMALERAACISPPLDVDTLVTQYARILTLPDRTVQVQRRLLEKRFGEDLWSRFSMTAWVSRLDLPGLIIHDQQDTYVSVDNARRIAAAWPDCELLVTSGLGHNKILRSRTTLERLSAFLSPLAP